MFLLVSQRLGLLRLTNRHLILLRYHLLLLLLSILVLIIVGLLILWRRLLLHSFRLLLLCLDGRILRLLNLLGLRLLA